MNLEVSVKEIRRTHTRVHPRACPSETVKVSLLLKHTNQRYDDTYTSMTNLFGKCIIKYITILLSMAKFYAFP